MSDNNKKHIIYRLSGMGADYRLFSELKPINGCEFVDIEWQQFSNVKSLSDYAIELSKQIDTSEPFSLLGVSMGGMVCSELTDIINPEKAVIISSAKTTKEIPSSYKRLQFLGITRLLNKEKMRYLLGNPARFFGVMNSEQRKLFYQMSENIDIDFIAWSVKAILSWNKKSASSKIVHIHGTSDVVLPYKNIIPTITIENGDHMMIWNKSDEINKILKSIFEKVDS
ncbi:MAG: alpha/beta hydrolase [Flavobacteriales bacterium]|nr:alpha/beta hydrolase [Flavobacteriales bacterium]